MIPIKKLFSFVNDEIGKAFFLNPTHISEVIQSSVDGKLSTDVLDQYFFSNLLKKSPYLLDEDTGPATVADFLEAEAYATRYNEKFFQLLAHPTMLKYLETWRDQVHLIMGKHAYFGRFTITHGATTTCGRGNNPFLRFKETQVTSSLHMALKMNLFGESVLQLVPWDNYTLGVGILELVPKTSVIGRAIVKPCAGDAFFQRSIGNALKGQLAKEGIDLSVSQDLHKRLAWAASMRNHLTTDDQKWASYLVYRSLVQYLAPQEWFFLMDTVRDKEVEMPDGTRQRLSQFATMGNGYCFELETIIFLGLIRTAAVLSGVPIRHKDIRVFGDDLIYPKELTSLVRSIGKNVGFITNVNKSFSDGYFRESCGGDYFDGLDIRPVYLKGDFNDLYDLTTMCNSLRELLEKHDWQLPLCYSAYLKMVQHYYSLSGRTNVLWGPTTLDGCLHGRPLENCSVSVGKLDNLHYYRTLKKVPKKRMSFRELAYKSDPVYLMRMVTAGYLKGFGQIQVKEQRLPKGVFGPPRPSHMAYPRNIPVPGTPYKTAEVKQAYYAHSQPWDQDKPLDIFKHLSRTGCMDHIYSPNYLKEREALVHQARLELIEQLKLLHDKKHAELSGIDDLVIDL